MSGVAVTGIINLLKPPGMTSNDCVAVARGVLRQKYIGHMGTLDPAAAGVLPLGLGRAARLFDYTLGAGKTYIAEMTLGITTDTLDQQGRVLAVCPVTADEGAVRAALPRFVGDIEQTPPAYSAIKVGGRPLYAYARAAAALPTPEVKKRAVRIQAITYLYASGDNRHMLEVCCSSGTYIRSLIADIGGALGCGAHCSMLIRTRACGLSIEDACTMRELQDGRGDILPCDAPVMHLPEMALPPAARIYVMNGQAMTASQLGACYTEGVYRAYLDGLFIGIAQADAGGVARMRTRIEG